uniref:Glycosyl transferase group 1 n=1 Tax=Nitratidesulfovibrio vulgaris (strain DSM 19637 / Miyazaki F) TaxID=883 RepID=B8DK34_NITV9
MKPHVMQLIFRMFPGGAERLALTTLEKASPHVRGTVCGLFGGEGPLVPEIEARGLAWRTLDVIGRSRLTGIARLAALLRREKVDILHAQDSYLLQWAAPAAWLTGVRLVYTEHATHGFETQPRARLLVRLLAPFLGGISCVTETLRNYMVDVLGVAPHRLRVIRNGVDTVRFSPAGPGKQVAELPPGWAQGGLVYGNVARFCDAKDHPGLLQAFAAVRATHPDARLLLVGDGERRDEAERLCRELGLEGAVHFSGTRRDIPELLRAMDVFVLSSRYEGMPVAVLEAMACGIPVVTTEVGGIGELVTDGETARVVPPHDVQALAAAMRWMADNPAHRQAMREKAMEMVRSRCSDEAMLRGYLALYGVGEAHT